MREKIGITNRSYSKRCQKLMTDFGAEESFSAAVVRMKEHHGVMLNVSAVRKITEHHAARSADLGIGFLRKKPVKQMTMELDGEMVPLVEYGEGPDRRKKKKNLWAELRVGVAQRQGEIEWRYGVSFRTPEHLGDRMRIMMGKMGMDEHTNVHGVGDGASWIPEQGERVAGLRYTHLIDLYHLCDYFAEAVVGWSTDPKQEVNCLKEQFEQGLGTEALAELKQRRIALPEHEGLRACIQYIENRPGQFEYKRAKERELPVGSGKVESTHRSLIQRRLKKPGTWWLRDNAEKMADLRVARANNCWDLLWQQNLHGTDQARAA